MDNILLLTDSYKTSHWKQYPPRTQYVYSYFESRGGEFPETTFFGLQYLLKKYLVGQVVTRDKINEAEELIGLHMGPGVFNRKAWEYILDTYDGKLPIEIKAVPEGSTIPTRNVLMKVVNTDPNCYWLTNYLETLLVQVWYPTTCCTISRKMKKDLLESLRVSGDPSLIDFKLHDFGFRGSTSVESSALGGAAHLVNFKGTDTMSALTLLKKYYYANCAGFSIPAAEHSTITSWGKDKEVEAYQNMLEQYPTGLVAVVSDSWNIYNAAANIWGSSLKDKVLARDGVLVIRPDSGDPKQVLPILLQLLGESFGFTTNSKGFKVLNSKVRLIQGDGISRFSLKPILYSITSNGWSTDNIAFGSGGGLLQDCNRDTSSFAFKCSLIQYLDNQDNLQEREVYKSPLGSPEKNSKTGILTLVKEIVDDSGEVIYWTEKNSDEEDCMKSVFQNGFLVRDYLFDTVRLLAS